MNSYYVILFSRKTLQNLTKSMNLIILNCGQIFFIFVSDTMAWDILVTKSTVDDTKTINNTETSDAKVKSIIKKTVKNVSDKIDNIESLEEKVWPSGRDEIDKVLSDFYDFQKNNAENIPVTESKKSEIYKNLKAILLRAITQNDFEKAKVYLDTIVWNYVWFPKDQDKNLSEEEKRPLEYSFLVNWNTMENEYLDMFKAVVSYHKVFLTDHKTTWITKTLIEPIRENTSEEQKNIITKEIIWLFSKLISENYDFDNVFHLYTFLDQNNTLTNELVKDFKNMYERLLKDSNKISWITVEEIKKSSGLEYIETIKVSELNTESKLLDKKVMLKKINECIKYCEDNKKLKLWKEFCENALLFWWQDYFTKEQVDLRTKKKESFEQKESIEWEIISLKEFVWDWIQVLSELWETDMVIYMNWIYQNIDEIMNWENNEYKRIKKENWYNYEKKRSSNASYFFDFNPDNFDITTQSEDLDNEVEKEVNYILKNKKVYITEQIEGANEFELLLMQKSNEEQIEILQTIGYGLTFQIGAISVYNSSHDKEFKDKIKDIITSKIYNTFQEQFKKDLKEELLDILYTNFDSLGIDGYDHFARDWYEWISKIKKGKDKPYDNLNWDIDINIRNYNKKITDLQISLLSYIVKNYNFEWYFIKKNDDIYMIPSTTILVKLFIKNPWDIKNISMQNIEDYNKAFEYIEENTLDIMPNLRSIDFYWFESYYEFKKWFTNLSGWVLRHPKVQVITFDSFNYEWWAETEAEAESFDYLLLKEYFPSLKTIKFAENANIIKTINLEDWTITENLENLKNTKKNYKWFENSYSVPNPPPPGMEKKEDESGKCWKPPVSPDVVLPWQENSYQLDNNWHLQWEGQENQEQQEWEPHKFSNLPNGTSYFRIATYSDISSSWKISKNDNEKEFKKMRNKLSNEQKKEAVEKNYWYNFSINANSEFVLPIAEWFTVYDIISDPKETKITILENGQWVYKIKVESNKIKKVNLIIKLFYDENILQTDLPTEANQKKFLWDYLYKPDLKKFWSIKSQEELNPENTKTIAQTIKKYLQEQSYYCLDNRTSGYYTTDGYWKLDFDAWHTEVLWEGNNYFAKIENKVFAKDILWNPMMVSDCDQANSYFVWLARDCWIPARLVTWYAEFKDILLWKWHWWAEYRDWKKWTQIDCTPTVEISLPK